MASRVAIAPVFISVNFRQGTRARPHKNPVAVVGLLSLWRRSIDCSSGDRRALSLSVLELLNGRSIEAAITKVRSDVGRTWAAGSCFWPLIAAATCVRRRAIPVDTSEFYQRVSVRGKAKRAATHLFQGVATHRRILIFQQRPGTDDTRRQR